VQWVCGRQGVTGDWDWDWDWDWGWDWGWGWGGSSREGSLSN
jgi:hypothetical protein